jgi:hypothetical protein
METDPPAKASAPAGASANPSATPEGSPAAAPSPADFVAVAAVPYPVRLFALDGQILTLSIKQLELPDQSWGFPMGLVEGDKHADKPAMKMANWAVPVAMTGSWPAGVDMVATGTTGRTAVSEHWTLQPDGAWRIKSSHDGAFFTGVARVGGSTIALESHANFPTFKPLIKTLRGPAVQKTVTSLDAECQKQMLAADMPRSWLPKTQILPQTFGGTREGALVSVGRSACDSDEILVEVWAPGSLTSTISKLPPSPNQALVDVVTEVVPGAGEKDAYVIYGDVFAFDGKALTPLPALPTAVTSLTVAKDGTLYAITAERTAPDQTKRQTVVLAPPALHKFDGKEWRSISLPAAPDSLATDGEGVVWVSAGTTLFRTPKKVGEKSVVASTPAKPDAAPSGGGANSAPARKFFKSPRPPGPLCPSNLVVLYGFTKVTPDDYDFPLTRKALKGHTEYDKARFVVAKDGGQKFFSAIVPDAKAGRRLVDLIQKEVKGSKPQLVCAEPEIVREVKIDLKSGDVIK